MEAYVNYLEKNYLTPQQYVLNKFQTHDVILLGENHAVKDNLEFVISIIPKLYENGIYNLGMEFGAAEDQDDLDRLITSEEYDENEARGLMYNYNVKWAYKEYTDVYKAAWKLNKSLPKDAVKFRVLNLSYVYNWSAFSRIRTPINAKKIFHKGNTEIYRANIIEKEVLNKGQKLLVLTGIVHAFTRYKSPVYDHNAEHFYHLQGGWLGNRLYEKYGNRIFSILLHQGLQNINTLVLSNTSGVKTIEAIMNNLKNKSAGFDLVNSIMGDIRDDSYYSIGYNDFSLKDLFDGYIFIKPLKSLQGCSIDHKYIQGKKYDEIIDKYPDKDWSPIPVNEKEYWEKVSEYVNMSKRYFID
ncbi:ChaN family lipoprotein [Clostridium sp. 19966]|uniref:ChaN family lipoprotein n=1 Tax=Clostridium sp. 19966 TaxID=2768166 RepID=UPI0028DED59F|nr:ChaN family lipoprotein [Clostridium sp. 19966]MDT8715957.1 ChaN family lipoprotein [Clostridium sp. 19966]